MHLKERNLFTTSMRIDLDFKNMFSEKKMWNLLTYHITVMYTT